MFTFSLTLVRHGETEYNRLKLLQGQGVDTLLSETGAQQGEAVGRYLRDIPFNNVIVSNLQRAMQTAEKILRNNSHCSGTEMVLEPLLRERGFGVAEGRPKEDLKNMANAAGQSCRDYTPPGGETLDQVRLRFKKFLKVLYKQMLDEHGWSRPDASAVSSEAEDSANDTAAAASALGASADDGLQGVPVHVLAVSHGAYIRVAVKHLVEDLECSLPEGVRMSQLFSPCPNTGISRFIFTLTGPTPARSSQPRAASSPTGRITWKPSQLLNSVEGQTGIYALSTVCVHMYTVSDGHNHEHKREITGTDLRVTTGN